MNRYGDTPLGMVESALEFARIARSLEYHQFVFSMKASNPKVMIEAYRLLVARLRDDGIKVGVVSGGSRKRLLSGRSGELLRRCDTVVTGDELHQGKPSPEGYIRAAQELQVAPAECLVIENAPLGIESAKNAGMACIGLCSTLSSNHLSEADEVVTDHAELMQLFGDGGSLSSKVAL
jgi:HAD superfamily hydrolase (TIGR01509 family)